MRLNMWRGLQFKIIAWSFIPTAIVLAAVALVGIYAYQQVTEALTFESSREVARLSAGQLNAELVQYADTLTALARMSDLYDSNPATQRTALKQAGNRLVNFDGGVILFDIHGIVVAAQPERPSILGQDWSDRDYLHQMIRTPGTVWSDVVADGPDGAPAVIVAVPLTGPRGELLGTMAGLFNVSASSVSSFFGSIVRVRINVNDAACLVDSHGRVIYHTNTGLIGKNVDYQTAVQYALSGRIGALRTQNDAGQEIVASYSSVPGTSWGLVTQQNWDALLAPGQRYGEFLLLLLALGLVLPAFVVTLRVRKITEPISQLIAATEQMGGGNLSQEISIRTGDELEELGQHFNQMSAQLAKSYDELKAREERFALVVQGTNDGIWDWDLRTDDVYYSPRWKGMLGYAESELANRFETWKSLLHPADVGMALSTLQAYLDGKKPVFEIQVRMRHKDGSYRWISTRGGALRDAQGKAYRMAGSHTDITERKLAEDALQQSEKRFAQVFHASPIPISITAFEDGRYIDANDAWLRLFGYRREEIVDNSSLHSNLWVQPEQRSILIRQLESTGSVQGFEHLARTKSGEVRDVLVFAEAIELNNQRYNLSVVQDITEQKRDEREIRRQNEYLAALHETTLAVVNRLQVKDLLEVMVERATHLVEAADGFVYLVTDDWDAIEAMVQTGSLAEYVGLRLKRGEGLAGQVWQWGKPLAVEDYHLWPGRSSQFDGASIGPEIGAPLVSGPEVVGVIGLTRRVSSPAFRQDEIDLLTRFAQLASIALENARLHTSVQQAYQTMERRVEERTKDLNALNSIAAVVSRSLDLSEIMSAALDKTMGAAEMERGLAFRLDGTGQTLELMAHRGFPEEFTKKLARLSLEEALAGRPIREDQPLVWDARTDYPESDLKRLMQPEKLELVVGVPLMAKKKLVGGLVLCTRTARALTGEESSLLSAIGQQVGIAVENARLYEQAEQSAALSERTRLARELHDSVTQSLYSVTLYAEAAARLLATGNNVDAASHLRELRDTAQEALREMRLLIFELRPLPLEKTGLVAALQARLDSVETRGGLKAELHAQGEDHLPPRVQEELYHIAQEALNNALKHSNATRVRVDICFSDAATSLEICDDGVGFNLEQAREHGGLGISGMCERAQRIGGQLEIESAVGKGTKVRIQVP